MSKNATQLNKRGCRNTCKHCHCACRLLSPCPASFVPVPCVELIVVHGHSRRQRHPAGVLPPSHLCCCPRCTRIVTSISLASLPSLRWHRCLPCTRFVCPIVTPLAKHRCTWYCRRAHPVCCRAWNRPHHTRQCHQVCVSQCRYANHLATSDVLVGSGNAKR